jgi:hypothetical protein
LLISLGYIYELDGAGITKLQFPKDEKQELGLSQHFLVLQIYIPMGASFWLDVAITDTTKVSSMIFLTL